MSYSRTAALLLATLPLALACTEAARNDPEPPPPTALTDDFDHTHRLWTGVLRAHVEGDRFDYAGLKRDTGALDAYLEQLHSVAPAQLEAWTEEQQFAFWINVYNASVVDLIVDHYPTDDIRDLGSLLTRVWDEEIIPMSAHHPEGKDDDLSLDDVEHAILRARFGDNRLHAAVNCGSVSCPPLREEAFVAGTLDQQLDEQMRGFVGDMSRNRFDPETGELRLSSIFDWFEGDFESGEEGVRDYLREYAPGEDSTWILEADLDFLDYDWGLNDIEPEDG